MQFSAYLVLPMNPTTNKLFASLVAASAFFFVSCQCALPKTASSQDDTLTAADLTHGRSQLQKMLRDRPAMSAWLDIDGFFPSKWAVQQFAGAGGVGRIYWNPNELNEASNEYYGSSSYPSGGKFGAIRLRSINRATGKPYDAETLWHGFVFETFNIQNAKEFRQIDTDAKQGQLTKEQFIEKSTRLEFTALQRTADFYKTVIYPALYKKNVQTKPKIWGCYSPKTYEAWIAQYTDHSYYPFDAFGKIYDREYSADKTKRHPGGSN